MQQINGERASYCGASSAERGWPLPAVVLAIGSSCRMRFSPVEGSRGLLSPTDWRYTVMKGGTGPRHLIFDKSGTHAYLTQELSATVTVFDYAGGRFLYATNRGDANEIVIYSVGADNGRLGLVGRQSSLGSAPREFRIDPRAGGG
jgi:6-phosphogluconolactonase